VIESFPPLHHVGIVVRDVDATLNSYKQYGISGELQIFDLTYPEVKYRGKTLSFSARYAFVGDGETRIELCQPLDDRSPYHDMLAERGEGVHHLCYMVDSVSDYLALLRRDHPESVIILEAALAEPLAEFAYVQIESGVVLELLWMG
jgi:methylmalonyl-CoA/ethylmalonyl-CoA epimerase